MQVFRAVEFIIYVVCLNCDNFNFTQPQYYVLFIAHFIIWCTTSMVQYLIPFENEVQTRKMNCNIFFMELIEVDELCYCYGYIQYNIIDNII